jgi:hypothetical protein
MQQQGQGSKAASLRSTMPQTAELVDWLRAELGKQAADRIVLKGKQGKGGFYAAEIGPDGVLREFGSSRSGGRAVVCLETGEVRMEGAA